MQYMLTQIAEELELYEAGLVPSTPGSAGIDLYVAETRPVTLHPTVPTEIRTGVHLWTDDASVVTIIVPRSSSKFRLTNTIGIIDSDYQGELIVKATANSEYDCPAFEPGDKFAQMLLMPVISPSQLNLMKVDAFSGVTSRGTGGFGSTDKRRGN